MLACTLANFCRGLHSPEPEHRAFSSSEGQVAVLDPVVGMTTTLLFVSVAKVVHRGAIGFKAVGDDRCGRTVTFQRLPHEGERRGFIPLFRDVALEDLAFVIDRAPEVDHLAVQLHVHLIEVPAPVAKPAHAVHPTPADLAGEEWAEPVPPQPHRLMAKVKAALEQQILDITQR